jgi:hypothetical protein
MSPSPEREIWRLLIETERLDDGRWRAWSPSAAWTTTGDSEQAAIDEAIDHALELGEEPDELVRSSAGAPRPSIELEADDPRVGWVWRFFPQTEQFGDGSWRAWFASGGWTVTGYTEEEVKEKANLEWFRRREDPDEIARRVAMMRRHLEDPVPGVENVASSVLREAWNSADPAQAVRSIIEGLDEQPPPQDRAQPGDVSR